MREIGRSFKGAASNAGLPPGLGLHTLRNSAATVMLENGVPLKVVSEILGHFSVSITGDIYGHGSPMSPPMRWTCSASRSVGRHDDVRE